MVINAQERTIKKSKKQTREESDKVFPLSSSEYIKHITALKRRSQSNEALETLHRISSLVKPIMKKHGLKVGILCEFFPKNTSLLGLNVNHGAKISLRLRNPHNDDQFLPFESVLGTMLHELTHNKHGPHNATFYKCLGELTSEMDQLLSSGYSGDGFFSKGSKLGGRNLSASDARKRAADNAEMRQTLFAGSGKMLRENNAGEPDVPLRDLLRLAAERRAAEHQWCGEEQKVSKADLGEEDSDEIMEIGIDDWMRCSRSTFVSSDDDTKGLVQKEVFAPTDVIDLTHD